MPEPATNLIGQVLANTYRVESLLGKGGMGAVYMASHLRLPTKVAIKVLHAEAASNAEIFARFRQEAEIASSLRHPNIVQVLDFNRLPDGTPYLIMEYLDGEDLQARLRQRGRFSYVETVWLGRAVGAGLSAAHRRDVVHRDLKPPNIYLCRVEHGDEGAEVVKVLDFGISKIRHAATDMLKTQDQQLLGTPHYMSPEQARGQNSMVDHRTDQFALAAILYQCLAGRLAFPGDNLAAILYAVIFAEPPALSSLGVEVPEAAEAALRRALSKDREARFPNIGEFVRAFCAPAQSMPMPSHLAHQTGLGPLVAPPVTPTGSGVTPGPVTPPPYTPGAGSLTGVGGEVSSGTGAGRNRRRLVFGVVGGVVGLGAVTALLVLGPHLLGTKVPGVTVRAGTGAADGGAGEARADLRAPRDLAPPAVDSAPPGERVKEPGERVKEPGDKGERVKEPGDKGERRHDRRNGKKTPVNDADDVDIKGI